jgi:hypothetical protein
MLASGQTGAATGYSSKKRSLRKPESSDAQGTWKGVKPGGVGSLSNEFESLGHEALEDLGCGHEPYACSRTI